ncbi:MAG: glu [Caulobacter sp.]|nr:glu [Caulobacter sp.]
MSPKFITRFAPSPTGDLHRGHAFSALNAWRAAKEAGGRFILRMEDIDTTRSRPAYEASIKEDLAWLGLEWDEPVRRQSEHIDDYQAALDKLAAKDLLYRDFRTRKDIAQAAVSAPHGPGDAFEGEALHPNEELRYLEEDRPFAWRLSLEAAGRSIGEAGRLKFIEEGGGPKGQQGRIRVDPRPSGDVVLARKDVGVAYHLAVVVDDALQGVTHVVRGNDLFEATHVQRLLQALLGYPAPAYRHHRLLLGPDSKKLSKRDKAETLKAIRERGVSAEQLKAELGF